MSSYSASTNPVPRRPEPCGNEALMVLCQYGNYSEVWVMCGRVDPGTMHGPPGCIDAEATGIGPLEGAPVGYGGFPGAGGYGALGAGGYGGGALGGGWGSRPGGKGTLCQNKNFSIHHALGLDLSFISKRKKSRKGTDCDFLDDEVKLTYSPLPPGLDVFSGPCDKKIWG